MDHLQDTPNSYKICSSLPATLLSKAGIPEYVVFTTKRQDLPLPSPKYLNIHATCCPVVHASGAVAYYRDADDYDEDYHSANDYDVFMAGLPGFDPDGPDPLSVPNPPPNVSGMGLVATVSG